MVVIDYIGIKASTAAVAARHSVAAACGPSRVALQPGRTTTRSPSAAGLDYGPLAARSALRARGGYKFDGRRLKLEARNRNDHFGDCQLFVGPRHKFSFVTSSHSGRGRKVIQIPSQIFWLTS